MTEHSVRSGAAQLHVETHGEATDLAPVLLTHGFCASGRMWDLNVAELSSDRQVITWDLRGHARTVVPDDPREFTVARCIEDTSAILDSLGIDRAVLCGMSLGGYLSLAYRVVHHERVAGLVLVDTGPGYKNEEARDRWNRFCESRAVALEEQGLAALGSSPEVGEHQSASGLILCARDIMTQQDSRVIESLGSIAEATLVVVGANDEPFLAGSQYMVSHIPGAQLVVIDDAGHASNVDQPAAFNRTVSEFLRQAS